MGTAPTSWVEHQARPVDEDDDGVSPFVEHLAETGAIAEAEAIWDAEDAGTNTCRSTPVDDLVADLRAEHPR